MPMKTRPRILFVCHEASRTGAPMFLLHFFRWLRRESVVEFEILLGKGGPLEPEFQKLAPVHARAKFIGQPSELAGYDLIYSNTCCNSDLLEMIEGHRLPIITHVHELDIGYDWQGARRMGRIVQHSHRFIACAEAVAGRLRHVFNIPAGRIRRHYEMIDPTVVRAGEPGAEAATLRRVYDIPENAHVVVGCGTFDLRKAPDLFVQVAAQLKRTQPAGQPVRFLWIGAQVSPDLLRALRADLLKLGLEGEVRFIGELPSPHALLALGDLFCLTSREDPFPLIMLEAATLGKPVVCFAGAGGGAEFCAFGGGVAVPYLDVAAMASACRELLADPSRGAAMGQRGRQAVEENFTVEAIAPALWADVQDALANAKAPPEAGMSLAAIYTSWNQVEAPQPAYRQAHLARAEARRKARTLLQSGQRKDATQVLVRAINADVATKDVWTICEGLCEISSDLVPFDPKQAELLVQRARELARANHLYIETLLIRKPSAVAAAA